MNFKCSSSWHFPNEITSVITSAISSPVASARIAELAVNGYYALAGHNVFSGSYQVEPWIEYDFGKVVQIQKVIAKARNATTNPHFKKVEVRVGNTSSPVGDFSTATLLEYYPDNAAKGEIVVFDDSAPLWGRYLSFKRLGQGNFVIGNLNILGEE